MDEVRRDGDDELCGFVDASEGRWTARTLFGVALGEHDDLAGARAQVLAEGLASLTERWLLVDDGGEEQVVCILEANPDEVTLALDHYALPGVPTRTVTVAELASGTWTLRRR